MNKFLIFILLFFLPQICAENKSINEHFKDWTQIEKGKFFKFEKSKLSKGECHHFLYLEFKQLDKTTVRQIALTGIKNGESGPVFLTLYISQGNGKLSFDTPIKLPYGPQFIRIQISKYVNYKSTHYTEDNQKYTKVLNGYSINIFMDKNFKGFEPIIPNNNLYMKLTNTRFRYFFTKEFSDKDLNDLYAFYENLNQKFKNENDHLDFDKDLIELRKKIKNLFLKKK